MEKMRRIIVITISLLIIQSGADISALEKDFNAELNMLVSKYNEKKYSEVITDAEKLLNEISDTYSQIRGKMFLVLGAAYEKSKDKDNAVENYLLGDMLLDDLAVEGMDFSKLEIFRSTLYGKVVDGKRVYEKVGKRKKRKKFPFVFVLATIGIVAAAILLLKKKSDGPVVDLKEKYAKEIFNEIEWIDVPEGEFMMGDVHKMGSTDERPAHKVYLDSYKISKYEITGKQFARFVSSNPEIEIDVGVRINGFYPVENLKRDHAEQFINWLRKYTGENISLPTEAQWEKAARGTDQRIYPWGNNRPDCSILNYNGCENSRVSRVGTYPNDKSFYGVMDMGGNVSEMCKDIYQDNYYKFSPYKNPQGPENVNSNKYVVRGSNAKFSAPDPRVSNREYLEYSEVGYHVGFRIVWN